MLIFLMSVVGLLIMALASIFEMTKQKIYYLAQKMNK